MNEAYMSRCPVKIGDRFYRNNYCTQTGACMKDYILVKEIIMDPNKSAGNFLIRGKYENRAVGPFERWYSSDIFKNNDWIIEKKGEIA